SEGIPREPEYGCEIVIVRIGEIQGHTIDAIEYEAVGWIISRSRSDAAAGGNDRSIRRIVERRVEHHLAARLFMRFRHLEETQAQGNRETASCLPAVLHIERIQWIVDVLADLRAALPEGGGVTQQEIGDGVAAGLPVEAEGSGSGRAAVAVLPMPPPEQRAT